MPPTSLGATRLPRPVPILALFSLVICLLAAANTGAQGVALEQTVGGGTDATSPATLLDECLEIIREKLCQ